MNRIFSTIYLLSMVGTVVLATTVSSAPEPGRVPGFRCVAAYGQERMEQASQDQAGDAEVARLRERVATLEAELKATRATISELEKRLGIVKTDDPKLSSDPMVILDDQPMASPDALLATAQDSYVEAVRGLSYDTERNRALYLRRLRQWITRTNKEYTGPITWVTELVSYNQTNERSDIAVVVVRDAETGYRLSRDFDLSISRRLGRRIAEVEPGSLLELRGIIRSDLLINAARQEVGPFNEPRFVGPFVEFGYSIDIQSLSPLEYIPWEQEPAPAPPPDGAGNDSGGGK